MEVNGLGLSIMWKYVAIYVHIQSRFWYFLGWLSYCCQQQTL